jgi:hypothetical protein
MGATWASAAPLMPAVVKAVRRERREKKERDAIGREAETVVIGMGYFLVDS